MSLRLVTARPFSIEQPVLTLSAGIAGVAALLASSLLWSSYLRGSSAGGRFRHRIDVEEEDTFREHYAAR